MNSAEKVVNEHLAKDGEKKTTVHKEVLPAVEHEHVQREQKDKQYVAVDRERHQDHYQTKVQPIADSEVLPEQHHHVDEGTETREFQHGDSEGKHARRAQAKEGEKLGVHENKRDVSATHVTDEEAQVLEGEHVHHHVHEQVQPVIQKETLEPHVVHKTKAIKEVHQHEPVHHAAEQLPPVSIEEFKKQGGGLDGEAKESVATYEGEPEDVVDGGKAYTAPTTRAKASAGGAEGTAAAGEKEEPSLLKKMVMGAGL